MDKVFLFPGKNFENVIHIPPFDLRKNELACVTVPKINHNRLKHLILYISTHGIKNTQVEKRVSTLFESTSYLHDLHNSRKKTIQDYLNWNGVCEKDHEKITSNLECTGNTSLSVIQLNEILLINIRALLLKGTEIIVYTTSGHDPSGIINSSKEIAESKVSGIDIIPSSVLTYYKSLEVYNKFIECKHLQ